MRSYPVYPFYEDRHLAVPLVCHFCLSASTECRLCSLSSLPCHLSVLLPFFHSVPCCTCCIARNGALDYNEASASVLVTQHSPPTMMALQSNHAVTASRPVSPPEPAQKSKILHRRPLLTQPDLPVPLPRSPAAQQKLQSQGRGESNQTSREPATRIIRTSFKPRFQTYIITNEHEYTHISAADISAVQPTLLLLIRSHQSVNQSPRRRRRLSLWFADWQGQPSPCRFPLYLAPRSTQAPPDIS